jgi:hypothetical protein
MKMKDVIENQREQMQEDLLALLDGLDQEILDRVCEVVVSRMKIVESHVTGE